MIYVPFRGICDFHGQNRRGSCVGAARLRPFWKRFSIAFDFSLVADFLPGSIDDKKGPSAQKRRIRPILAHEPGVFGAWEPHTSWKSSCNGHAKWMNGFSEHGQSFEGREDACRSSAVWCPRVADHLSAKTRAF